MIFSDFYRSPRSPLSKLRHYQHQHQHQYQLATAAPDWVRDEYADLLSRDKVKQKDAIKRYLADKIRNDWTFDWPPQTVTPNSYPKETPAAAAAAPTTETTNIAAQLDEAPSQVPVQDEIRDDDGYHVDEDADLSDKGSQVGDDAESIYSIVSEDPRYQALAEWTSDLSDNEDDHPPLQFESPDAVGSTVRASVLAKQARRRKQVRDEVAWNQGLACFEARRNAWTGARTVRVRVKPASPISPTSRSPRRFLFHRAPSTSPPASTRTRNSNSHNNDGSAVLSDASSVAKDSDKDLSNQSTSHTSPSTTPSASHEYPVQALIPVAQPLLPPHNPLRASITPSIYLNLYDKVILHSLQPSCPINLSDMLRSCVAGWKRDGEWPPQPTPAEPSMGRRKSAANGDHGRRLSIGILGRDKTDESRAGRGIRRSIQRALGIGHSAAATAH
ncbi:hypothetical protein B0I35DRAFT_411878 [Stachybotrys elegans]|uniref:Gag1-like clamp domain-containing protein n=1 Tax=Stachybotrys elegans TaxID=80388 RepID=A0A8K0WPD5_9HYPO|nr:hypothetical protein B0I35DRAFT_411878 [Stachybotrys elegans]